MTKPAYWPYQSPEHQARADAAWARIVAEINAPLPDHIANDPKRLAALERLAHRRIDNEMQRDRDEYRDEMSMTDTDMRNWERPW